MVMNKCQICGDVYSPLSSNNCPRCGYASIKGIPSMESRETPPKPPEVDAMTLYRVYIIGECGHGQLDKNVMAMSPKKAALAVLEAMPETDTLWTAPAGWRVQFHPQRQAVIL